LDGEQQQHTGKRLNKDSGTDRSRIARQFHDVRKVNPQSGECQRQRSRKKKKKCLR
jgi:hypothetical protein